jgi:prophage regulatory protein
MTPTERPQAEVEASAPAGLRTMLSLEQLLKFVPFSAVTLWRLERGGQFPRGSFISPNKKIWWLDEIQSWQREVDGRRRGRRHHPGAKRDARKA